MFRRNKGCGIYIDRKNVRPGGGQIFVPGIFSWQGCKDLTPLGGRQQLSSPCSGPVRLPGPEPGDRQASLVPCFVHPPLSGQWLNYPGRLTCNLDDPGKKGLAAMPALLIDLWIWYYHPSPQSGSRQRRVNRQLPAKPGLMIPGAAGQGEPHDPPA